MTKAERGQCLTCIYAARSSCRLKSSVALSSKNFSSTKVARGARRVKDDEAHEITAHTCYLSVHTPQKADAMGLISCVNDALQVFGIGDVLNKDTVLCVEKSPLLVGGGTDSALVSMYVGVLTGMMGQIATGLALAILVLVLHSQTRISLQGCFH